MTNNKKKGSFFVNYILEVEIEGGYVHYNVSQELQKVPNSIKYIHPQYFLKGKKKIIRFLQGYLDIRRVGNDIECKWCPREKTRDEIVSDIAVDDIGGVTVTDSPRYPLIEELRKTIKVA